MYKVKKTDKKGFERTMTVNTTTWHRILSSPGLFAPDKYELVIEKVEKPVLTILGEEMIDPEFPKDEPVVKYSQDDYDADVVLAKENPSIEIIERMLEFKPTPYWKGKLNKIK